jgi:hypothetical protein
MDFLKNVQIWNVTKIRVGAELFHSDGQTDRKRDMTKLIANFRNSANAPNKADIAMQCHDLKLLM